MIEGLLALGLLASSQSIVIEAPVEPEIAPQPRITQEMRDMTKDEIRSLVVEYLGHDMLSTISCESGFKQYEDNGRVLRSPTADVGIAQINVDTWEEDAKELGHDIYTPLGNLKMAQHIKKVQGKSAWVCWKLQNPHSQM